MKILAPIYQKGEGRRERRQRRKDKGEGRREKDEGDHVATCFILLFPRIRSESAHRREI